MTAASADRDSTCQPYCDPRILNGRVFVPPLDPAYADSLRGYARSAAVFPRCTSANRFCRLGIERLRAH